MTKEIAIGTVWVCSPIAWEQGERPPGWPDGWEPNSYGGVPWPGFRYVGTTTEERAEDALRAER